MSTADSRRRVEPMSTPATIPAALLTVNASGVRPRRPGRSPAVCTSSAATRRSTTAETVGLEMLVRSAISGRVIGPSRKIVSRIACSLSSRSRFGRGLSGAADRAGRLPIAAGLDRARPDLYRPLLLGKATNKFCRERGGSSVLGVRRGRVAIAVMALSVAFVPAARADTVDLAPNWQVVSSAIATDPGDALSQPGFDTSAWLKVKTNDANAPGGEVAAELQNTPADDPCGANNIFYGENITTCQGAQPGAHSAPLATGRYGVPWWFRTEFTPNLQPGQTAQLEVRGIMGQADLWGNGTQASTRDVIQRSEPEYRFDVTSLIRPGANALALKLYPNNPGTMLTQDFNDWTQTARDQNTGIKYPVRLHVANALQLSDAHVNQRNADDLKSTDLTVKGVVKNTSAAPQTGDVKATILDPDGAHPIDLAQTVTLAPGETKTVTFDAVHVDNPRLWWPYQMGDQPLYKFTMSAGTSDSATHTFGVR